MYRISRVNLKEFIKMTNGKMFSIEFVKKDGSIRTMVARIKVKKGVKGIGRQPKNPLENPYINVFDMHKNAWRKINLETARKIKFKGIEYEIY